MTNLDQTRPGPLTLKMPVIFAAHGAPILLDDADWMGELAAWAADAIARFEVDALLDFQVRAPAASRTPR